MLQQNWNADWKYWIDRNAFALVWNIPEHARDLTLPHDAMIETEAYKESPNGGNTGFHDGDVYNYVKLFEAPQDYRDKTVIIKFEGVYMNTFVYVNGQMAAKCPFGYSTFFVPIHEYLNYGQTNEIRVIVRNGAMTNSRWYSGGGIYRDVYLLVSDLSYILPEGVQIQTELIEDNYAVLNIAAKLKNRSHRTTACELETEIADPLGNVLTSDRVPVVLFEQDERKVAKRLTVDAPELWSDENPVLYTCTTRLLADGEVLDESVDSFGIRTLSLDARKGLRVNGKSVKLRGACIHHDSGLLGAATYDDAQYRQVRILKEAGFNAIRMSHHPMAPSMLRACDELGVYVMDEGFDMWSRCKSDYDYGLFFDEWWEKDVEAMVRKDFNHPSVIMYSLGNEIPEIGTDYGSKLCYQMCSKVKALDPGRYTLASINGIFASGDVVDVIVKDVLSEVAKDGAADGDVNHFMAVMDRHLDKMVVHREVSVRLDKACAYTDIAGYNYMTARYEGDGKTYPDRVIVGSETYPPAIARNWEEVQKHPYVIGDFTWTGWEYMGEVGFGAAYPCQISVSGDIDITGKRKPASYFREIVFGLRNEPYITVQNPDTYEQEPPLTPWTVSHYLHSWTWRGCENKPVRVEIFAAGDQIELYFNGELIGRKEAGASVGYRSVFETVYKPGELLAISYENGVEISRSYLKTAGVPAGLRMTYEAGQKNELIFIPIEVFDEDGDVVFDAQIDLNISVSGSARLEGFGSGNPAPVYSYTGSVAESYHGCALAILKRTAESGNITVSLQAEGLDTVSLSI